MRRMTPARREGAILALMLGATLTLILALAAGTWVWMSGRAQAAAVDAGQATVRVAAEAGVRLRQVSVEGREHTRGSEILAALDLPQGSPLLALDPQAARDRLESLPWVKEASVERRFPDLVHVRLTERMPIAVWDQGDGAFALVDADGVVITDAIGPFAHLPVISGRKAPQAAAELFTMLAGEPALAERLKAAVRIGQRRWNLWFHKVGTGGVEVRLPETEAAGALTRLAGLEAEKGLLQRAVKLIDMRLPDRLVVRLADDVEAADPNPGVSGRGVPLPLRGPARDA